MRDTIKIIRKKPGYIASINGELITKPLPKSKIHKAIDACLEYNKIKKATT